MARSAAFSFKSYELLSSGQSLIANCFEIYCLYVTSWKHDVQFDDKSLSIFFISILSLHQLLFF
ncbi:hypothetical protein OIU79_013703 [Salix purpurea]|uniref:Uncharacterized protein n=1 Tax=Salix purpurea TaxID=77065 RepID=A0A9Q0PNW3_SALPP|nr:hypothetical protein OIU79_013703 [Salix purpurea]